MHVYLESLGCRLNAAETESIARRLAGAGYIVVGDPSIADVIVLNSCAVTARAARKSRQRLRALHRLSPDARLAALGCWATEDVTGAEQLPGVAWVIPNADKMRAVEIITGTDAAPVAWSPGRWGHTRAFLGVQDGCDHACTYCITRILRGPAHSRPLANVVREVCALVEQGAQEVVLSGVSLGAYGHDSAPGHGNDPGHDSAREYGLADLVGAILRETTLPRLRLSSIEPWDVDAQLLRLWANPRLCRQLHVPLQSGADTVLKRMGRRNTAAQFVQLVETARAIAHDIAITTDIIVGFPGETEADFTTGLRFVERMAFARLHVFPYSERAGTPAVRLPNPVPKSVRAKRAAEMRALGQRLATAYRTRFVGQTLDVLWERQDDTGHWRGLTGNYLAVVTESERDLYNRITQTHLVALTNSALCGEIAGAP